MVAFHFVKERYLEPFEWHPMVVPVATEQLQHVRWNRTYKALRERTLLVGVQSSGLKAGLQQELYEKVAF